MAKQSDASAAKLGAASLLGLAVAVGLGIPFALAEVYNPSAPLGPIVPVLYAALTAGAVVSIGRARGITSERTLRAMAVSLTFAGYLASWIPWEHFTLQRLGGALDADVLLLHPGALWDGLVLLYEGGAWTVGSAHRDGAVAGPTLGLVWALEAILVLAIALQSARSSLRRAPTG